MNEPITQISTQSPGGATVKTTYVERQVRAFAVFETEVDALSSLNAQATVFFSVASATLSFAVGIWTNAAFSSNPTPEATIASRMVAPVIALISVIFIFLGVHAWNRRTSVVTSIREQSSSTTK